MAKKTFLVDIDLNKNQMLNMVLQNLASAPANPVDGQAYFNTTDHRAYFYDANAATWISVGGSYTHPNHTGDVTSVADGAQTISQDAVTNAKLANMATSTIKGRATAGTGDPEDLSATQVRTILNVEDGADVTDATNVSNAGALMKTAYDAQTVLAATTDNNPAAVTIAEQKVLGRVTGGNIAALDIDSDLSSVSANHDTIPSAKATKAYVDGVVTGALVNQGGYNASTNSPDLDTAPSGTIKNGWTYVVTAAGTFFTEAVQIGDMLIAKQDSPSTLAHWTVVNKNIPDIVSSSESAEGIAELATQAETDAGTDDARIVTPLKLSTYVTNKKLTKKYEGTITGNSSDVAFIHTHSLGTKNIITSVREATTDLFVEVQVTANSTTQATFTFNVAPATAKVYYVTIIG
ncbi:MAG: hypothetical protein AB9842_07975 [Bacteroidales bacterium]